MAPSKRRNPGIVGALLLSAGFLALASTAAIGDPSTLGDRELVFEENAGQTDPRVKFTARGPGYGLFLTSRELVLSLHTEIRGGKKGLPPAPDEKASSGPPEVLRLELVGGNPAPRISAEGRLPGTANYFLGNDPAKWRTGVATSSRVRYAQVYEGVDLVSYGDQKQLEYDFIVAPGSDPSRIRLAVRGARRLELTSEGDLLLHTPKGTVRQKRPLIYQEIDGARRLVAGGYRLRGKDRVSFAVGPYERNRPLVIDPVLIYSSYLSGSGDDSATAIAVDSSGNAYVAGVTDSIVFPTTDPVQPALGGSDDIFVTKFDAAGHVVYSTYLGGDGWERFTGGLAVGPDGSVYLAGRTSSTNFPIQTVLQGCWSNCFDGGFVARLHPSGQSLTSSYYLGDAADLSDLALDASGNIYVTGRGYPVQPGGIVIGSLGDLNALVFKIDPDAPDASKVVYATYVGGSFGPWSSHSWGRAIAVDDAGNAYVTGGTMAQDFPTVNAVVDEADFNCLDCFNGFVFKLNPSGAALSYSTFLGGGPEPNFEEEGTGIAVDTLGQAYVTGYTYFADFPALLGDCDTFFGGQFALKVAASGDEFSYSTCIPGTQGAGYGEGIAIDSAGSAYLAGENGEGVAVNKINASGTQLAYSMTVAGSLGLEALAIAIDPSGNAYLAGGGGATPKDAFVFKLSAEDGATAPSGGSVIVSTAPGMSGDAGVTAQLTNDASGTPNVVLENFPSDPGTAGIIDVGGKYVDLKVTGADLADTVAAKFYYPTTITGSNETNLELFYFTGSAWAAVRSSGGLDPAKDTIDSLDGTISGGRFAVLFDATSTPKITELTGTVFTSSVAVSYGVCLLYDPTRSHKKGSTIPIKIQLCDGARNLSAADVRVTALGVVLLSTSAPGALEDSGNANPDSNFRYDSTLGDSGGYIYNLKTTALQRGTYSLRFRAGADQVIHTAEFQVR